MPATGRSLAMVFLEHAAEKKLVPAGIVGWELDGSEAPVN